MARNNGRWGRLQRVLAQDSSNPNERGLRDATLEAPGDTPRYGVGANIENHPQVTDYVPRKFRSMAKLILPGLVLLGLAEYAAWESGSFASITHENATDLATRIAAWTTTAALAISAVYAHIIYLLKRHRLDDLKGRYRAWRTGSILAILLGFDAIAGLHALVGRALDAIPAFHLLGHSTWWLLPTLGIFGIVYSRIVLNAAECRSALVMFVASAVVLLFAIFVDTGWLSVALPEAHGIITRTFPALSATLVLMGSLLTARYVVLDVQGLIQHRGELQLKGYNSFSDSDYDSVYELKAAEEEALSKATQWTDGSEPDFDYSEDKPLSKAERKRLRKQNRRNAA